MSSDPRCKIGRVRFKSGGELRVLTPPKRSEAARKLVYDAVIYADQNVDLDGFVLITFTEDARYGVAAHWGKDFAIPRNLLPAWVEECVRRELVTTQQIHDVLAEDYYVKGPGR